MCISIKYVSIFCDSDEDHIHVDSDIGSYNKNHNALENVLFKVESEEQYSRD